MSASTSPGSRSRATRPTSFSPADALELLESRYDPPARALYCSFDPHLYYPEDVEPSYDLGYMGTYWTTGSPLWRASCSTRHGGGPRESSSSRVRNTRWPSSGPPTSSASSTFPSEHRKFYSSQGFTLNVTRADMIRAGWSPSVRLFEVAACGVPIISDYWEGLEDFFDIGREILVSRSGDETLSYLQQTSPEDRAELGRRARERVLTRHTAARRAAELEAYAEETLACAALRAPRRELTKKAKGG